MLIKAKPFVKLGLLGVGTLGAVTLATNPKLLKHPTQLFLASLRLLRCGYYGSLILFSYYVF